MALNKQFADFFVITNLTQKIWVPNSKNVHLIRINEWDLYERFQYILEDEHRYLRKIPGDKIASQIGRPWLRFLREIHTRYQICVS